MGYLSWYRSRKRNAFSEVKILELDDQVGVLGVKGVHDFVMKLDVLFGAGTARDGDRVKRVLESFLLFCAEVDNDRKCTRG